MTTIDRTGASDAEFQARIATFDAAPVPLEGWDRRVEVAARAMAATADGLTLPLSDDDWLYHFREDERDEWIELAAAALTADAALAGQHTTDGSGDE